MQGKQATGIDTRMMVPVYAGIFGMICQLFLPWISMPELKYCRFGTTYNGFQINAFAANVQQCAQNGGRLEMAPFSDAELALFCKVGQFAPIAGVLVALLLLAACAAVFIRRGRSVQIVRAAFMVQLCWTVVQFLLVLAGNMIINDHMSRANSFQNLTIHSQVQLTSWVYAQMFGAVGISCFAARLLRIQPLQVCSSPRSVHRDHRFGRRTAAAVLLILIGIPAAIFFGIYFLNDRSSVFIGCCIICLSMLPFAMVFEGRQPQARELLLIAVMSAIAVVGRAAFFMVPQFKPTAAIVIIAGVSLGPEAGFLIGAVSGFVSNFFFGQGPWTPWQMFALGIIGFIAGLLFSRRKGSENKHRHRILLSAFGGLAAFGIYGFLMDFSSVVTVSRGITKELLLARMVSGFPFNVIHGVATTFFLLILSDPMERKISRIRKKYGLMES